SGAPGGAAAGYGDAAGVAAPAAEAAGPGAGRVPDENPEALGLARGRERAVVHDAAVERRGLPQDRRVRVAARRAHAAVVHDAARENRAEQSDARRRTGAAAVPALT